MADHPLRPATDRCLGKPLPYQLANRTRDHQTAINLSPPLSLKAGVCGISLRFQRLFPTAWQVPTRYSPVRHYPPPEGGFPFDLHVLSMPPAFVLSQDQTLKLTCDPRKTGSAKRACSYYCLLKIDCTNVHVIRTIHSQSDSELPINSPVTRILKRKPMIRPA